MTNPDLIEFSFEENVESENKMALGIICSTYIYKLTYAIQTLKINI